MANREMCKKVLDYIEEHPDEFDMENWADETDCGTTACVAGHAILLNGGSVDFKHHYYDDGELGYTDVHFYRQDGSLVTDTESEGQELLGLSKPEAMSLFYTGNDRALALLAKHAGEAACATPEGVAGE